VEQIVSVDGYAEDANGGIDFFVNENFPADLDAEQLRMLSGVGAIVVGARTYRMFADFWPWADPGSEPVAAPMNQLPKFVVSSTLESAPWGDETRPRLRGDGVGAVSELRRNFDANIIVWGSLTLTDALFRAGEVDLLRLWAMPVLLGAGRSFSPADPRERDDCRRPEPKRSVVAWCCSNTTLRRSLSDHAMGRGTGWSYASRQAGAVTFPRCTKWCCCGTFRIWSAHG